MKIILCTSVLENQAVGPANFARTLLEFSHHDKEIDLLVLTEDTQKTDHSTIKVHIPASFFHKPFGHLIRNRKYADAVVSFLKDFQCDLVLFNDISLSVATSIRLRGSIPVIGFINDDNHIFNIKRKHPLSTAYHLMSRYLEKRGSKLASGVVVNSEYLKHQVTRAYHIPGAKIQVLYKGVPIERIPFKPERAMDAIPLKILFVKNDWVRGGLEDLVIALGNLRSNTFSITVAGPSPHYRDRILALKKHTSNIDIEFEGITTRDTILEMMQDHHILCIPSRREALGVANIEGLTSGIPVVTTTAGGIPEVTGNGQFAWIATPGDPESLESALRSCIGNQKERVEMSVAGRRFVEDNFTARQMWKNFKVAMGKVLKGNNEIA